MATLQHKMDSMKAGHDFMLTTVIGIPYAPSVASFKDLHKGMIRDLRLETNHRGSYLLLRFKCSAMRMNAVLNIVEDEAGTVVEFTLYMQEPEVVRAAETILKNGAVIILKEPYFKVATSGSYLIRVDHPTDIVWLSEDDPRAPVLWRTSTAITSKCADYWKKKGNDLVGTGKFYEAIEM